MVRMMRIVRMVRVMVLLLLMLRRRTLSVARMMMIVMMRTGPGAIRRRTTGCATIGRTVSTAIFVLAQNVHRTIVRLLQAELA